MLAYNKNKTKLPPRKGSSALSVRGWVAVRVRSFHVTRRDSTNVEWVKFTVVSGQLRGARRTPLWEFAPCRSNTVSFGRDSVKKTISYYGALKRVKWNKNKHYYLSGSQLKYLLLFLLDCGPS